jgi:hypothetical protein
MSGFDALRNYEELPFSPDQSPFRVKGVFHRGNLEYIDQVVPGGVEAALGSLRDERLRSFFRQPFLASQWYDVFPLVAISYPCARLCGKLLSEYLRARSRYQAEQQRSGIYRQLLDLRSPSAIAMRLPLIAEQLYDFGSTCVREVGENTVEVERGGMPASLMSWYIPGTETYIATALEASGATWAKARTTPFSPTGTSHGLEIGTVRHVFSWG